MSETATSGAKSTFRKMRDYFLPPSIRPAENIPDILSENRKTAIDMAKGVMTQMSMLSDFFGVPLLDLVLAGLPEECRSLESDGIRESAAAKTYWDLSGTIPLADICKGTRAYPLPTLRCAAQEYRRLSAADRWDPKDSYLRRLLGLAPEDVPDEDPEGSPAPQQEEDTDDDTANEKGGESSG